jgi:hypothetical protein
MLDLFGNRLAGEVPAALGRLDTLEQLHSSDNQLTGRGPREVNAQAARRRAACGREHVGLVVGQASVEWMSTSL